MEEDLINKVTQSQLITLNPLDYFPTEIEVFDLKDFLFMELILKEKDFREALKKFDWSKYEDKNVTIICSTEAIIPLWAYMLVTTHLQPVGATIMAGSIEECRKELFTRKIYSEDFASYEGKRIVLKGCGDAAIPEYAYTALTFALLPYAKSIMYGEPCSTVPVFKRK